MRANITSLLKNEAYVGTYVFGRTDTRIGLKKGIKTCPSTWVRVPDAFEPIIPKALFVRAQRRFAKGTLNRSDEYFLKPLRALYEREGYLSSGLIKAGRLDRARIVSDIDLALDSSEVSIRKLCAAAGVSHHSLAQLLAGRRVDPQSVLNVVSGLELLRRQRRGKLDADQDALAQLRNLVRRTGNQRRAAEQLGISRPLVSRILSGKRAPSAVVVDRLKSLTE
jgi:transcriptional regulator with XRE-family HTH domain